MKFRILTVLLLLSITTFCQNSTDTVGIINVSINGEEIAVKKYSSNFRTDLINGKTYLGFIFQVVNQNLEIDQIEINVEIDSVVKFVKPDFSPIDKFNPKHGKFKQDGTGFMYSTKDSKMTISFLANIEGYLNFFSGHFEYVAIRKKTQETVQVTGDFENIQYWYILDNEKHGYVVN